MLQLQVKMWENSPGNWMIQVTASPPQGPPYFFQKDGFLTQQACKSFFVANARMWALNMGTV